MMTRVSMRRHGLTGLGTKSSVTEVAAKTSVNAITEGLLQETAILRTEIIIIEIEGTGIVVNLGLTIETKTEIGEGLTAGKEAAAEEKLLHAGTAVKTETGGTIMTADGTSLEGRSTE
jgi:hypothetical protein